MARKIKRHIFLVDNPLTLKSLHWMLKGPGVTIRCFSDPDKCLEQLNSRRCDLLIAKHQMPEINGIDLLKHVRCSNHGLPVLIISKADDITTVVEVMKAGADDFLDMPLSKNILLQKVKSILQKNGTHLDAHSGELLSHTEMKVLKLVAESKTSSEIAGLLHRSYRTIQVHRASLLRKLNAKNSVALIRRALEMGLIDTEPSKGEGKTIRKPVNKR